MVWGLPQCGFKNPHSPPKTKLKKKHKTHTNHCTPHCGNAMIAAGIFQIIVATKLNYLMEFLTFCQHFNNFFHALFSCLLFFCGLKAKSNGEKIGLIETHKKRFCFFVFAKFL